MSIRYISYYTAQTVYEKIIFTHLIPCLDHFHLPYHIFGMSDLRDWKLNVLLQPQIIWTAMKTFPNDNIVWLDADTTIHYHPELFYRIPQRSDIGFYSLDHEDHYGPEAKGKADIMSNVLYIKNSEKMLHLIEEWMTIILDHNVNHRLEFAKLMLEKIDGDLNIFMLPRVYSYLPYKDDGSLCYRPVMEPIIVNYQVSLNTKGNLYGKS